MSTPARGSTGARCARACVSQLLRPFLITCAAFVIAFASSDIAYGATGNQERENPINDQGSSYNYRSTITSVTPRIAGLRLEVLEFADRLVLHNDTGETVTVYGYQGEPYAQVLADGTVQVNRASPAYYLNQNFYGQVSVPSTATPRSTPRWSEIDRTGTLQWHDHRIHWMSPLVPPQVKDKDRRTKIFDWRVPIQVGSERATINGELFWVPEQGTKPPVAAIVVLLVLALAGGGLVVTVRRRRKHDGAGGRIERAPDHDQTREAW